MPTNKNAQLRYQVLDRCLGDFTRYYTFEDLLDEVNAQLYDVTGSQASVRTLRNDLAYMEDRMTFGARIKRIPIEGRKCYYRYEDRNFSIYNNELSVDEVDKLSAVIDMLGRYRGNSNYAWVEEALASLECRFGLKANTEKLVSFEGNDQLRGIEFLSDVIDATINHQTLRIRYKPFDKDETEQDFHPYYVKQYNGRWFLFGRVDGRNSVTNYALDRIESFKPSSVEFKANDIANFDTYFDDVIGVSKGEDGKVECIRLKFASDRFPYIKRKPIHKLQKVVDEANGIIELNLIVNKELESRILSYGPQVEVLEPESLRRQIIEKIQENLKKYSIVQKGCTFKD